MKKLLMIYEGRVSTVLEIKMIFSKLCEIYKIDFIDKYYYNVNKKDIDECDILMCVRGEIPGIFGILNYAKNNGKKVVFYLDDDLKDVPKSMIRFPRRSKWVVKCLAKCDILITCNELIAEEYKPLINAGRTVVMHTPVNENEIIHKEPLEIGNSIRIVYAASDRHGIYFDKYIQPFFERICKRFPNELEWHFVGVRPNKRIDDTFCKIHYVNSMPLNQYREYMKNNRFHIGLAPLESTHFTERKYFNKYIEYTKYGICGVYSCCNPYKLIIKDRENGYFAKNSIEDWENTIIYVINNVKERESCIINAQRHLLSEHKYETIFNKLIKEIPEFVELDNKKDGIIKGIGGLIYYYKAYQKVFIIIERFYLTARTIKVFGMKKTMSKIKGKFKRNCL